MSLREEMWKYEQITGESAEHVPIIKLGAFLDGYDMAIKALEQELCDDCVLDKIMTEINQKQYDFMEDKDYDEGIRFGLMLAYQIINKYKEESEVINELGNIRKRIRKRKIKSRGK